MSAISKNDSYRKHGSELRATGWNWNKGHIEVVPEQMVVMTLGILETIGGGFRGVTLAESESSWP